ncbi:amidase [Mesorhizobium sp. L-8-3]|uniref:amidase n=1 Tax=Mesorhizobium sp. L-8-3 TaxID=2744522 RepID=UPI0019272E15|nr:amidase [Mesorhizobium sp. L-8-3]BCH22060.1 putative amidase AmiD [Mesorhizobium sp. L-8-3]
MTDPIADLAFLGLMDVGALIRSRTVSSRALLEAQLQRIAMLDGRLHSYVQVLDTAARIQAEAADEEIAAGRYRGPLHGVPVAIKDLCWIEGVPTAAGTTVYKNFVPAEDATVVRRLRAAGAVLIGKTQLTEGAYSDHHPSVIPPCNPWNGDYWTGISSSGSAVATAAGLCFGAIASDTGGSIRWPCAANGTTGIKPTWGRVSRHGVFELAASLDHVGTIARSVVDAGAMLAAIAGHDPRDPTTSNDPVPDYMAVTRIGAGGLRIGIDAQWNSRDVDPETQAVLAAAAAVFAELGAELVPIAFPDVDQIVADWVPNCAVEAAVAHEGTYAAHKEQYGSILASVIEAGQAVSGTAYQKILLRRAAFRGRVENLFRSIDLLLTPVQPFAPLMLAAVATLGERPDLVAALQRYTCPFDMSGHPTLSFPAGFTGEGMPIGLQLVAGHLREAMLLRAGAAFQNVTTWHNRHPAMILEGGPMIAEMTI